MEMQESDDAVRKIGKVIGIGLSALIYGLCMGPLVYHYLK